MKKQKPMVTIPVKHTCVPLHDYISLVLSLRDSENNVSALRSALGKSDLTIESLKKKNEELNERIRNLSDDLKTRSDSCHYWYTKYTELDDKFKSLKSCFDSSHPEAAPNAKTEAD